MGIRRLICPQCRKEFAAAAAPGALLTCPRCRLTVRAPQEDPLFGRTIGGFHIIRRLGHGGMGAVYLAEQLSLHRYVALKGLRAGLHTDAEALARLRREAISGARLTHPNIVQVYDIVEIEGVPYIVMEYVNGVSARRLLHSGRPLAPARALSIIKQVLAALARAHREHLVHCDVKPENILIDREGAVKVADFGLANIIRPDDAARPGLRFGTPAYMSPEHARREPYDCRADIYSVGATLYEMLTGRPPYVGRDAREVLAKIGRETPPPPHELNPQVPKALSAIVMRMIAPAPADRYPTAEAALAAIAEFEAGAAVGPAEAEVGADWLKAFEQALGPEAYDEALAGQATTPLGWRRRRAWTGIAFAVGVVLAAGIVFLLLTAQAARDAPGSAASAPVRSAARAGELERALGAATEFADKHPTQHQQIIANFERLREAAAGTPYAERVADRLAYYRARRDEEAERAYRALIERADRLAAEGRHAEAERLLPSFPPELLSEELRRRLVAARDGYYEAGRLLAVRLEGEARAALATGQLEKARELFSQMHRVGYPSIQSAAEVGLQEVAAAMVERDHRLAEEARREFPALVRRMAEPAARRDYAQAFRLADEAVASPHYAAVREALGEEKASLAAARAVCELAAQRLRENPGMPFRIKGILGKVKEVRDGRIVIETPAGELAQPLVEVSGREIARLAAEAMDLNNPENLLRLAAWFTWEQLYPEAHRQIEAARKLGADTTAAERRLRLLERGVDDR